MPGQTDFHSDKNPDQEEIVPTLDEKRAASAFNYSLDAILMIDVDTKQIFDANASACDLLGYTEDELVSRTLVDLNQDAAKNLAEVLEKGIEEGCNWLPQIVMPTKQGRELLVEISVVLVEEEDGDFLLAFLRDVSDREKAAEALEIMASFAALNPAPVLRLDQDGVVVTANPAAEKFFGISPLDGQLWTDICCSMDLSRIQALVKEGGVEQIEINQQEKTLLFQYRGVPELKTVHIYGFDITARKKVQRELEELNQTLEKRVDARTSELMHSMTQLENTLEGVIYSMAKVVELRDPYTAGHQARVAELGGEIARQMGFDDEFVTGIIQAGLIHDIGKIYVPAEILSKPTRLTETEFAMIKAHVEVGGEVVEKIEFPWPVKKVIMQHHERLDGTGYPNGLAADEIIMEARIIAVADVVEAMSSHRPYRPSLGIERALEEIEEFAGVRYDLQVVEICLKLFRDQGYSFQ